MNKLDLFKKVVGVVVGAGIGTIVKNVVESNVTTETNWQTATVFVGRVALAMAVSDVVCASTNKTIDEIVESVSNAKEALKK